MWFQILLASLHAASAAVITAMRINLPDKGFFQVTRTVPHGFDNHKITYQVEYLFRINLFFLIFVFLAFTSLAHSFYWYNLATYNNTFSKTYRWIEYGFSAAIMGVIIAILSGISDIYLLLTLFGLISITMYFGYAQELEFQANSIRPFYKTPFFIGCFPYVIAWGIIMTQFYTVLDGSSDVPWFVRPIIWITFSFFSSFAVIQYYYSIYCGNLPGADRKALSDRQDNVLHILSLTSKLTLAYWVLGGVANMS